MRRITATADGPTDLDRVWGLRPEYFAIFMGDFNASLRRMDPVLVELARIRLAQLVESDFDQSLRYQRAVAAGLTEEKIAALADYPTSDMFDDRERAVLEFTEQFAMQSSSISDEDCLRLQQHLTAREFIYLTKALSTADQFARANSAFRLAKANAVPASMPDFTLATATLS
jgi:alkylhydroperoxidase family enzyme